MRGEHSFVRTLVELFGGYHRQCYGGWQVGEGDVLIRGKATLMDHHRPGNLPHLKVKLDEMSA